MTNSSCPEKFLWNSSCEVSPYTQRPFQLGNCISSARYWMIALWKKTLSWVFSLTHSNLNLPSLRNCQEDHSQQHACDLGCHVVLVISSMLGWWFGCCGTFFFFTYIWVYWYLNFQHAPRLSGGASGEKSCWVNSDWGLHGAWLDLGVTYSVFL